MHGPAMAGWLLVALCAGTGGYCLLRLRSSVDEQRSTAGGEALMGFGMAAMAVPAAVLAPPRWAWLVYAAVFAGAALRTVGPAGRTARHGHHLVGLLAMVYMAGAMAAAPDGMRGMHSPGGAAPVTGVLLVYYAGYVLRTGARLIPLPADAPQGRTVAIRWGDRTELALACRLSMGLAMLAMLLTL